jgi:hypothetical protein
MIRASTLSTEATSGSLAQMGREQAHAREATATTRGAFAGTVEQIRTSGENG